MKFDIKLILLGFLVALFSAGIGIGGGTLLVSILMSVFGFDFKKAAGTSLATIIPISFIGAVSHFAFLSEVPCLKYYFAFIQAESVLLPENPNAMSCRAVRSEDSRARL